MKQRVDGYLRQNKLRPEDDRFGRIHWRVTFFAGRGYTAGQKRKAAEALQAVLDGTADKETLGPFIGKGLDNKRLGKLYNEAKKIVPQLKPS